MSENKEPREPNRKIPLTTFKELLQALSSERDVKVRFTVPEKTWLDSLPYDKRNQTPPDEMTRTHKGLLIRSYDDRNKITIFFGKPILTNPPDFAEDGDEKIKDWKIVRIKT